MLEYALKEQVCIQYYIYILESILYVQSVLMRLF